MIALPFQTGPGRYSVLVVLEQENIDRIKNYDPAIMDINKFPNRWANLKLDEVLISFGTTEDIAFAQNASKFTEIMKRFTSGFKFKPERGDTDDPYKIAGGISGGMN